MPEIVDPLVPPVLPAPTDPTVSGGPQELEILAARRAFATAQFLLEGSPIEAARVIEVGWHDSSVSEQGCFAVIAFDSGLDDLIGEVVQVAYGRRTVLVYVLAGADVPVPFSIARRPFAALRTLAAESIECEVAVIA